MADITISINPDTCRKDGLCIRVCPKVFTEGEENAIPIPARPQFCNGCGHCMLICPENAIEVGGIDPERIREIKSGILPSFEQVQEMVRARRSIRNFLERPVSRESIDRIIDAARLAPSAKNTRSTHFTIVEDPAVLKNIAVLTAQWLGRSARKLRNPIIRSLYLMRGMTTKDEYNRWISQYELTARNMEKGLDTILYKAPLLILFHAGKNIRFAEANANLALQNATFAAQALGIGSFYTGYVVSACIYERTIPDIIRIPRNHRVFAGLALGYPRITFDRWLDRTKDDTEII